MQNINFMAQPILMHRCTFVLIKNFCYCYQFLNIFNSTRNIIYIYMNENVHIKCYSSRFREIQNDFADIINDWEMETQMNANYVVSDSDIITGGDEKKNKQLKMAQLQLELMNQQGKRVPDFLSINQWKKLISITKNYDKKNYLQHLFYNHEKKKYKQLREKLKQYNKKNKQLSETKSCEFINKLLNYKMLQSSVFGSKIIIDMGYEEFMTDEELLKCSKQISKMWHDNRMHSNPFYIVFCNVQSGTLMLKLKQLIPNLYESDFPSTFTDSNYLELYPRNQLVYLTPYCEEELDTVDPQSIYIIGAITEIFREVPLSFEKAKKSGLRMAKLPLNRYLNWYNRKVTVTLRQCLAILNDVKDGASWEYGFRHIPKWSVCGQKLNLEEYRKNLTFDLLYRKKKTFWDSASNT